MLEILPVMWIWYSSLKIFWKKGILNCMWGVVQTGKIYINVSHEMRKFLNPVRENQHDNISVICFVPKQQTPKTDFYKHLF